MLNKELLTEEMEEIARCIKVESQIAGELDSFDDKYKIVWSLEYKHIKKEFNS